MKEKEIIENNRLIAEFMGKEVISNGEILVTIANDNDNGIRLGSMTCYHTSWDWLHPVINKLYEMGVSKEYNEAFYKKKLTILNAPIYCEIKDAFEMTVEAITWFNNQSK